MTATTDDLLHAAMGRAAHAGGDGPAVVDPPRAISYAQLDERSNQIAHLLAGLGVERGDRVGLYLDKSIEAVVGVYGILKRGAAYVPLDPLAPPSRLGYIAGDCGSTCLLTGASKRSRWPELVRSGAPLAHLVVLDGMVPSDARDEALATVEIHSARAIDAQPQTGPASRVTDTDLGYILYTSGSTGRPKGVMLSHRNGRAFVDWAVAEFGLTAADRLSSHAPLHFDLSTFDLFAAASAGAPVVLVPRTAAMFPVELARFIADERITVWYSVPSALTMLVQKGGLALGDLPELRTVLFAGEVFPTKHLRALMGLLPHARFCNLYGPTETNVCTWYDVSPLDAGRTHPIPIGRAIRGVETVVMTEAGRRARPGETGVLHVAGPTVMLGYWGDDERTGSRLVGGLPGLDPAVHAYDTGDLVCEDEGGDLLFVGRRDNQIKSRGYRIELGDVEAALVGNDHVVECAVLAIPDELVTNRLAAAVVADEGMDATALSRFCAKRLPTYMVPESFAFLPALPKTSTGKVDRQRLVQEIASAR